MFGMNTQIIRTDLITLEWQTDRKRKHEGERHCLGCADVAPRLFILSNHSIVLLPPRVQKLPEKPRQDPGPGRWQHRRTPRLKSPSQASSNSQALSALKRLVLQRCQLASEQENTQG